MKYFYLIRSQKFTFSNPRKRKRSNDFRQQVVKLTVNLCSASKGLIGLVLQHWLIVLGIINIIYRCTYSISLSHHSPPSLTDSHTNVSPSMSHVTSTGSYNLSDLGGLVKFSFALLKMADSKLGRPLWKALPRPQQANIKPNEFFSFTLPCASNNIKFKVGICFKKS